MARSGSADEGSSRLVALKVVSEGYPLRGQLQVLAPLDQPIPKPALAKELTNETLYDRPSVATRDIPASGEVWVEPAVLEALELKIGDSISLGERTLTISNILTSEPDRGAGFMSFSPRVLMNQADLAATGNAQGEVQLVETGDGGSLLASWQRRLSAHVRGQLRERQH